MNNKKYYTDRYKSPKVPKGEEGMNLKNKLITYLKDNGGSLSAGDKRRIRKGIEDLNPDLYYALDGQNYRTYKKDADGKYQQVVQEGSGITLGSGALSSNRNGIFNRNRTDYGGQDNPRRVRDAIALAISKGMLQTAEQMGITEGGTDTEEEDNNGSTDENGNLDLDSLIGTKPDNLVTEGEGADTIYYAVINGNQIPVILNADGTIKAIRTLGGEGEGATFAETPQFDADGNQINDSYTTGVSLFDESKDEFGNIDPNKRVSGTKTGEFEDAATGDPNAKKDKKIYTDPKDFQRFVVDTAQAKNPPEPVNGKILGVKTGRVQEVHNGVSLDWKVGPKTLALATKLGIADQWGGAGATSSSTSSDGSSNFGYTEDNVKSREKEAARLKKEQEEKAALEQASSIQAKMELIEKLPEGNDIKKIHTYIKGTFSGTQSAGASQLPSLFAQFKELAGFNHPQESEFATRFPNLVSKLEKEELTETMKTSIGEQATNEASIADRAKTRAIRIETPKTETTTTNSTAQQTSGSNTIVLSGTTFDLTKGAEHNGIAISVGSSSAGKLTPEERGKKAKELDSRINTLYSLESNGTATAATRTALKNVLTQFNDLLKQSHPIAAKVSLKKGGKVQPKKTPRSLDLSIQAKFNTIKSKATVSQDDIDTIEKELAEFKSMTKRAHSIQSDLKDLKEKIKIFEKGGKNSIPKSNIKEESMSYLDFLMGKGKEGDTSQGFFKQGGINKFSGGGVQPGQPYRDSITGKIVQPTDKANYNPTSLSAQPLTSAELNSLNNGVAGKLAGTPNSFGTSEIAGSNLPKLDSKTFFTSTAQSTTQNPTGSFQLASRDRDDETTAMINAENLANTNGTSNGLPEMIVDSDTADNAQDGGQGRGAENLAMGAQDGGQDRLKDKEGKGKGNGLDHTTMQFLSAVGVNMLNSNRVPQRKQQAQDIYVNTVTRNPNYANQQQANREMFAGARARTNKTSDATLERLGSLSTNSQQLDATRKLSEQEAADYRQQKAQQDVQRFTAGQQRTAELNKSIAIDNETDLAEDKRKDTLRSTIGNLGLQYADVKKLEKEQQRGLMENLYGQQQTQEAQTKIGEISKLKAPIVAKMVALDRLEKRFDNDTTEEIATAQAKQFITSYNKDYPGENITTYSQLVEALSLKQKQFDNQKTAITEGTNANNLRVKAIGALQNNYTWGPVQNPGSHMGKFRASYNKKGGVAAENIKLQRQREKQAYKEAKENAKAQAKNETIQEKNRLAVAKVNMTQWTDTAKQYNKDIAQVLSNIDMINNPKRK